MRSFAIILAAAAASAQQLGLPQPRCGSSAACGEAARECRGQADGVNARLCQGLLRVCSLPCAALFDVQAMREVIQAIGLVNTPDGKALYGPDMVFMNHAAGTPQGLYQIPDQIIRAMQTLVQHVQPRTYLEYGVFTGWNACLVTAFLSRFSHPFPLQAYAADITTKRIAPETLPIFSALNIKYIHSLTELPDILAGTRARHELIDVCFIDAVHSYKAVRQDFERLQGYCKVCKYL
jgi:cephalosporin hydroxylase